MIPFSICGGILHWEKVNKELDLQGEVEIRLLELYSKGFTFRLPKGFMDDKDLVSIEIKFYSWQKKAFETLMLHREDFAIAKEKDEENEDRMAEFYFVFRIETDNKEFRRLSDKLSSEYLYYIDVKMNLSDEEMSSHMCNYPLGEDDIFGGSRRKLLRKFAMEYEKADEEMKDKYIPLSMKTKLSFAIAIENDILINDYLEKSIDEFKEDYFKERALENHPVSRVRIDRLYLGNSYCPNLFPKIDVIKKVINKAREEGLKVTLVLAPLNESIFDEVTKALEKLAEANEQVLEIQANDLGTYSYLQRELKGKVNATKGLLLYKGRRDPRSKYREESRNEDAKAGNLSRGEKEVYFPFYQTNTGTFCTLYSIIQRGERGKTSRVTDCPKYCLKYEYEYPAHLNMVGNYNSLFALEKLSLLDLQTVMEAYSDIERLVINL